MQYSLRAVPPSHQTHHGMAVAIDEIRAYMAAGIIPDNWRKNAKIKTKTKTETKAGETAQGARSAPHVGVLTRFVSVFFFVLIFVFFTFDFRNIFID